MNREPDNLSSYKRIYLSIIFLSVAIIAFELVLMQILSVVQWYHFAYMVISIALLGFGAAGTFLAIFRKWLLDKSEVILPVLMISCGTTMAMVMGIARISCVRFDSYLLFADFSQIWRLVFTYTVFFIPFFLGALAIGLAFVKFVKEIGKLYFANLVGSGAGGVVALGLIWLFLPQKIPAIISVLPLVSGIILMSKRSRPFIIASASISLLIISFIMISPPRLVLSEFKGLTRALNLPEAGIDLEKSSPYGLMQVVSSPALRYAPGLSLTYKGVLPPTKGVFRNGDWFGPVILWKSTDAKTIMDHTTSALPYCMNKRDRVLALNAGTGANISHAITQGANKVTGVEPNSTVLSLLQHGLSGELDGLFDNSSVSIHNMESRTYLAMDTSTYDLIMLPMTGAFGGTCGLYALKEQYLLTKEAFREMWLKLSTNGVISITCWMDYPVRNPLKILATIAEMLEEQGIKNPKDFVAAVRSWGTITFIAKKSPISSAETQRIRDFCNQMSFDPAILPDIKQSERAQFNILQDDLFFEYIDRIMSSKRAGLYSEYDFNIRPATDNRPYFSQFLRWQSLPHLAKLFGDRALPFFEIGYLIVMLTFVQIAIGAFVLIILPLFRIGWKGGNKTGTILYFSGIGLGYMFVEIVFIQGFILYFGNPVYSAAAVITSMLICSGIGSYVSSSLKKTKRTLLVIFGSIVVMLFLYAIMLTPVLQKTMALPFAAKLFFAFLLVSPLSFLMGMPFPLGMGFLAKEDESQVAWAWGINGCSSVISTVLATIIAVEMGFVWVMVFASFAYSLPLIAGVEMRS